MNNDAMLEFSSRECKHDQHSNCSRHWRGLGFIALCSCACHKKNVDVSTGLGPEANVIAESSSSSKETKENAF